MVVSATMSGAVPYVFSLASIVSVPSVNDTVISVFVSVMFCDVMFPDTVTTDD